MNIATDHVLYEVKEGIAFITLNRPDSGNAITSEMKMALPRIWEDVRDNRSVRVAIITGAGNRHLCTGADMSQAASSSTGMAQGEGPLSAEVRLSPRQNHVWKPVICAVNGTVAGGGLHFVVDSDIVVSVTSAQFIDTHVNVGQVGGIENVGLAKRLPLGTALRMTIVGREYRLSAERAYHFGLVDELVDPSELESTCLTIAEQIKRNSPTAVSRSMQAVWRSLEMGYTDAMEYGWALVKLHRYHPDSIEGPKAYVEKREPKWTD